jgi:hypothetical protein
MKTITKRSLLALAVSLLGFGVFTQQARATQITGTITFTGSGNVSVASGVTTISFDPTGPGEQVVATTNNQSYPSSLDGDVATFQSINVTNSGPSLDGSVTPLWTFTVAAVTYSFNLTSLTSFSYVPGTSILFSGGGTAMITGFTNTAAIYSLSGVYNAAASDYVWTLSDETVATPSVPDGGTTIALLGIALIGIEALRRKIAGRKPAAA